jgi:arsenate reductase
MQEIKGVVDEPRTALAVGCRLGLDEARQTSLVNTEANVTGDQIVDEMIAHPVLVNRPIVVTPKGTMLCRPSERVFELLDRKPDSFTKEDGEIVKP